MTTIPQESKLEIIPVEPAYGVNYNKGYIGFTYDGTHPVGRAIAYFTRWHKMSDIHATHALIVTGKNSYIEADAFRNCVKESDLNHYFDHENCQIFFRKPKGLNDEIANRIVESVNPEIGKEYDFKLILSHVGLGSFTGHLHNCLSRGRIEYKLSDLLDHSNQWICSELAAYALDEQPEYHNQGILKHPNATINPQELFEDSVIFEPWKDGIIKPLSLKLP